LLWWLLWLLQDWLALLFLLPLQIPVHAVFSRLLIPSLGLLLDRWLRVLLLECRVEEPLRHASGG
jgi:hypothetical protein